MVDVADPTLSVRRQGKLLEISRSSTYYQAISVMSAERIRLDQHYFSRFVVQRSGLTILFRATAQALRFLDRLVKSRTNMKLVEANLTILRGDCSTEDGIRQYENQVGMTCHE